MTGRITLGIVIGLMLVNAAVLARCSNSMEFQA